MSHQEGPSLHDFMAQDTSFLSQLQRSEGDDYIEYRIYSDRTREGEDAHEIVGEGGVSSPVFLPLALRMVRSTVMNQTEDLTFACW